jgi:cell surface protein SprA
MRPNWTINYNGLNKLSFIKRWIKTATLSHSYRSTFSIGGYTTSSQYDFGAEKDGGFSEMRYEFQTNFLPKYEINSITINEQFSPLFGLDLTWVNSLITKFEIKKSRTLALGFSNNQLNENKSNEYVIGTGYRIKDVSITLKQIGAGGKTKNYKSDINIRVDLSIRNSLTLIRKLEEGVTMPTAGQTNITIKTSADYTLSDRFIIKIFYDKTITNPKISTTYRTSQASFGVSVRFQLVN